MSTLRTTHIQHPSATEPNITLHSDGKADMDIVLDDLNDVTSTTPGDNDLLTYSSSTETWAPAQLTLDDISEGSNNLYYTDGRADGRISAAVINDLSDVNASPSDDQFYMWDEDAQAWVQIEEGS